MAYHHPIPGPGSGSGSSSSSGLHFLNSPFGDTTFTKVFVGGLAWETQSETLRRHFEQYGEILEAVVISDKNTGRSKGYGFVTFRDPESARRACADPSPIIDGRRANCNLASLGRPRPATPYAQLRPPGPYFGGVPVPRGAYVGSSAFHQTVPYGYHQAIPYSPYGYPAYGPEYAYSQNVYNPYMGQQYVQVYSVPNTVNTAVYPYGQLGQPVPAGHGYTAVQGYTVPGHHFVQLGGPNINGVTASARPTIQAPYASGSLDRPKKRKMPVTQLLFDAKKRLLSATGESLPSSSRSRRGDSLVDHLGPRLGGVPTTSDFTTLRTYARRSRSRRTHLSG